MQFLFLNQFYPPDPAPTGWYLHGLARELVGRGHAITVVGLTLTGQAIGASVETGIHL